MSKFNLFPYQQRLFYDDNKFILALWNRLTGKTFMTARLALKTAHERSGSIIIIISPTLNISSIVRTYILQMEDNFEQRNKFELVLKNGSIIKLISVNTINNIRGYSADLVIIDDIPILKLMTSNLIRDILPTLAEKQGQLIIFTDYRPFTIHYAETSYNPAIRE